MKTRAAVVHQPHQLSIETIELDLPKVGEILVRNAGSRSVSF